MIIGYKGLKYINLSISSPIQNSSGLITSLLLALIFSVKLSVYEVICLIIMAIGVIMLSVIENKKDITLGFFKDGKFIFHSCNVGNGIIPTEYRQKILEHLTQCSYLSLRDVLELKGITINENAEVKLNTKGDLINFFSL